MHARSVVTTAMDRDFWQRAHELRETIEMFFRQFTGNADDARELTQQTYLRLADSDSVSLGKVHNVDAFVKQTALRIGLDWRARVRKSPVSFVPERSLPELPDPHAQPSEEVFALEQIERLRRAFERLPERTGLVFQLRRIEGLSVIEVASRLGMSPATVKRLCCLALTELKKALADEGGPADG